LLSDFSKDLGKKPAYFTEIEKGFDLLVKRIVPAMQQEEEVIFPYIRQIAHAHKHREPYAALFIRTLRKPVEEIMFKGHKTVTGIISSLRSLTNNYTIPPTANTDQKVLLSKLKELDDDLMQHLFLEDSVLFPHVMTIEKDLLNN
ncbi:MAG TPA: hemerythrin domain-containing protein, partial [Chitinophagaceae bacterium]|nr:hemerythrin domain-containing protein [Chitinophagaceae bacterium]